MTQVTPGDWYAENLAAVARKPHSSEADVSDNLVRPVLSKVLGFHVSEIDAQPSDSAGPGRTRRPDFVCRSGSAKVATVIFEVKKLEVDLTKRTGRKWTSSPLGQLQDYLENYRQAGDGTWGVVTNGTQWIVIRRSGDHIPPFNQFEQKKANTLARVRQVLKNVGTEAPVDKPVLDENEPDWLSVVATCASPEAFIRSANRGNDMFLDVHVQPKSALVKLAEYETEGELLPRSVYLCCLRLDFPDGNLTPPDIADELEQLRRIAPHRIVGVAYTGQPDDRLCRGFLFEGGRLHATSLIDPLLPGSRAELQFAVLARHCEAPSATASLHALSSTPLHKKFHEEIGSWFSRAGHGPNELRHLVRVMFTWILQEREILPDNALWDQGRKPRKAHEVHRHIEWLLAKVLGTPRRDRQCVESDEWKESLNRSVPFLNGSLFTVLSSVERPRSLTNSMYLANDGLLSILRPGLSKSPDLLTGQRGV